VVGKGEGGHHEDGEGKEWSRSRTVEEKNWLGFGTHDRVRSGKKESLEALFVAKELQFLEGRERKDGAQRKEVNKNP